MGGCRQRPDEARDAIFAPAGLIGMHDRTPAHVYPELLVGGPGEPRQTLQQADDAAMGEGEAVLPLQPLLDLAAGEPFHRRHVSNRRNQPRSKATLADPLPGHVRHRGEHPLAALSDTAGRPARARSREPLPAPAVR